MVEKRVGKVTHYYTKLGVAAIELEEPLHKGERVHIVGHTTDTEQPIDSMELEHHQVEEGKPGENIAIKVDEHVREHDEVYKAFI